MRMFHDFGTGEKIAITGVYLCVIAINAYGLFMQIKHGKTDSAVMLGIMLFGTICIGVGMAIGDRKERTHVDRDRRGKTGKR